VVGPEGPLVKGVYDFFANDDSLAKIGVIGPSAIGAQLEGSKAFAKDFMSRHDIPTAAYREFTAENLEEGMAYLESYKGPYVLKADGLAAGKGVLIIEDEGEAKAALEDMIMNNKFGSAGAKVVVEQFLKGIEFSVFVLTDGVNYHYLPNAKDYKRIGEGDTGLNTGGMGAISPVPFVDDELMQKVDERIVEAYC
jgi:phosphoribosylamine--glycine ligase